MKNLDKPILLIENFENQINDTGWHVHNWELLAVLTIQLHNPSLLELGHQILIELANLI